MGLFDSKSRKNRDEEELPEPVRETLDSNDHASKGAVDRGVNCSNSPEVVAVFDKASCELVHNKKDSWIVLGRDRTCSKASGYGGAGHTGAHMIDLVVGRNKRLKGNPSFMRDAARIYISQKTDSDLNFECSEGHVGLSKQRSGIGMMADDVRITARKGIKLITQGRGTENSLGVEEETTVGIDLIGGNQGNSEDKDYVSDPDSLVGFSKEVDTMQPIAKSIQTAYALKNLVRLHLDLVSIVEDFMSNQQSINETMATHDHYALGGVDKVTGMIPVTGPPELPQMINILFDKIMILIKDEGMVDMHKTNCNNYEMNHLEPSSAWWIGSRFNYTN
jgi:hypothetical protein